MIRKATWKFSTDEYVQMHEAGILPEDARVELLDGEIVPTSPIGSRHADMVALLDDLLREVLGNNYRYFVQNPLRLSDRSMPEPDLMVLQKKSYKKQLPTPADVFLLIEVGDTSSTEDRDEKLPLYAAENIPEVWLVDLNDRTIEQYSNPVGKTYSTFSKLVIGQIIRSTNLPDLSLEISRLFDDNEESYSLLARISLASHAASAVSLPALSPSRSQSCPAIFSTSAANPRRPTRQSRALPHQWNEARTRLRPMPRAGNSSAFTLSVAMSTRGSTSIAPAPPTAGTARGARSGSI